MVSSNKILTVSYGTFSCTLEGFDNSFDTMKAIAEYFRDLAQDDRYFGAEPPTPDAEMLARIAEREIARRVEARFEKGNLVLRASDDAEPPHGDVAPQPSRDAALDATAGVAATALAVAAHSAEAQDVAPEPALTDGEVDEIEDDIALETAELDLSDLDTADEADDVSIDLSEMDLSEMDLSDMDLSIEDEGMDEEEAIADEDIDDEQDAAFSADDVLNVDEPVNTESSIDDLIAEQGVKADRRAAEARAIEDAENIAEAEIAPAVTDSVADKLQRIRAVVAAKSQATPDYIEDEHAMSGTEGDGIDENDALDVATEDSASLDDNLFTDTIAAIVSDQLDFEDEDEDDAFLSEMSDDEEDYEDVAPVAAQQSDAPSELDILRAKIAELEAQAAAAAQAAESIADANPLPEPVAELDDENDLDLFDEDDADEDHAPQPLVARVTKAKRADFDAAIASGDVEEYDDEDEDETPVAAIKPVPGLEDSTLTPEQEAELARELADLHAELEEEDWDFDDEDDQDDESILSEADQEAAHASIRKAVKLTSPARAMLTDTSIEEDTKSVERLADKTDTEMEEPEGNRRRSAIAHLRAAVAATKADRILGFGKKTVDEEEPYREDLADAVRPRRPKITEARSARPAPVRPAPLKLVAEQRVDTDAASDATPVRPRRVVRNIDPVEASENMAGSDTGFAEFAENQGAHTLPELLEAAAAYMSFVEGHDQFSRPQLMTKLLQAEGEASSREERLRSFGQLLRDGKIEKKGGGRFAASDSIGFKPNERAAG
ncbi:MAG: hypothetical protein ACEPO2_02360 [Pelagibaca sp.]